MNHKNKSIDKKYLRNKLSNLFLKVQNSLLEKEKDFIELNDIELKDSETKIKREIGKLFFKPHNITLDDMYRSEKVEIRK